MLSGLAAEMPAPGRPPRRPEHGREAHREGGRGEHLPHQPLTRLRRGPREPDGKLAVAFADHLRVVGGEQPAHVAVQPLNLGERPCFDCMLPNPPYSKSRRPTCGTWGSRNAFRVALCDPINTQDRSGRGDRRRYRGDHMVRPLTKRKRDGVRYVRPRAIESEIAIALRSASLRMTHRAWRFKRRFPSNGLPWRSFVRASRASFDATSTPRAQRV